MFAILSFLLAFFQRVSSGFQSMFGYAHKKMGFILASLLMIVYPILFAKMGWIFYVYVLLNMFIVYMKFCSFKLFPKLSILKRYEDIHLWEDALTGLYVIYLTVSGFNILMVILAVYPALILHKGLINIGNKLPFFSSRTDDLSGKTYGIPLLGIKIKRSSTSFRIACAILSFIGAFLVIQNGWILSL